MVIQDLRPSRRGRALTEQSRGRRTLGRTPRDCWAQRSRLVWPWGLFPVGIRIEVWMFRYFTLNICEEIAHQTCQFHRTAITDYPKLDDLASHECIRERSWKQGHTSFPGLREKLLHASLLVSGPADNPWRPLACGHVDPVPALSLQRLLLSVSPLPFVSNFPLFFYIRILVT